MDFFYLITIGVSTTLFLLIISFSALIFIIFTGKSIKNPKYPPVMGTVFHQLFYFNRLYDYHTKVALKYRTFRLLAPSQSEIYTTDPRNIEHILKTNFENYSKGEYNQGIMRDLFGHGIFAADGNLWRQQRKLASFEFSTRVLRDFSCSAFRRNAAQLGGKISEFAIADRTFDLQVLMKIEISPGFRSDGHTHLDLQ